MGFSISHILVVLGVAILVFGTARLRNAGRDLGKAVREFRNAVRDTPESHPDGRE